MTQTWAVVPSNGRPYLQQCINALAPQVEGIVIVANQGASIPETPGVDVVQDPSADMNISRWWNLGIDHVASKGLGLWNTLVVNDDVVVPEGFVSFLEGALRATNCALAFPNQHDGHRALWKHPEPVNLFWRMTGYCFMLRGEYGLRLDESLAWWYGDDDLDWRARGFGGSYLVPGMPVFHQAPNGSMLDRPELHTQAGRDRETFIKKWGRAPW